MDPFPIIVVHCGKSQALEFCLRQAVRMCPESRIVLLGDAYTPYPEGVEFHDIHEPGLYADVEHLRSLYRHMNCWSQPEWEFFCMARWLIVRNFMRREGLEIALSMDSDVLLFCDAAQEAKRFALYAMTFAHWGETQNLIHLNFIHDREALESFCAYLMKLYQDEKLLEKAMISGRERHGKLQISDMSIFYDWSTQADYPFCFFEDFYEDGVFFDSCIDFWRGFRTSSWLPGCFRKIKRISWKKGIPYVPPNGKPPMPALALHYHAQNKFLIPHHFGGKAPFFPIFIGFLKDKIRKIPRQIRDFWNRKILRNDAV